MSETKALVPVMTSNTTPSGNVIYYYYNGHNFPTGGGYGYGDRQYYAFDKANNTCCCINQEGVVNAWIGYEFSEPVKANKLVARLGNFSATDSFVVKAQYHNGTDWVDAADPVTVSGLSDGNSQEFIFNFTKTYTSTKFRLITPTTKTSGTNLLVVEFQLYSPEPDHHLKSSGSTEAIRDWLNASLYNKEEIDNLFIQNNQAGLIPYDLTIEGYEPEQMIKLVGQTSGKTYNICLAALMGEDMLDYKLTEQKTRIKWIDGKPIYQKTIDFGALPNNTQKAVLHNILNADKIWICDGFAFNTNEGWGHPLNFGTYCIAEITNSSIAITANGDQTRYNQCYVTLFYTKTTD